MGSPEQKKLAVAVHQHSALPENTVAQTFSGTHIASDRCSRRTPRPAVRHACAVEVWQARSVESSCRREQYAIDEYAACSGATRRRHCVVLLTHASDAAHRTPTTRKCVVEMRVTVSTRRPF